MTHFQKMKSPVGNLFLVANESHLYAVIFEVNWASYLAKRPQLVEKSSSVTKRTAQQLSEYFRGERKQFDLPYELEGTDFQKQVWIALDKIPYGKTVSYQEQAETIGKPKAVRAVGGSNGLNPLSIVLPCHRVIGKSGKLTGYGGGLHNKEFLLRLEGIKV